MVRSTVLSFALFLSTNSFAQVEELSQSEMTEAYVQDGNIIIKQSPKQAVEQKSTHKANLTVGPGKPVVSPNEAAQNRNTEQYREQQLLEQQMPQAAQQQLQQIESSNQQQYTIPSFMSPAQQAQQAHAHNLVREGLNLPQDTPITNQLMAQYLQSFSGQSTGAPLGPQQTISADSFQFIIPNPGQYKTGTYTSGDGSISVESNQQNIIFNLLYPQRVE
ncbi:hypothetical protein [Bermanella sp. R86510]|uniref:hypothetical protein n=1 Tax=unclassified Bermanella TaxID=2627862 RepID=UPI0037C604E1